MKSWMLLRRIVIVRSIENHASHWVKTCALHLTGFVDVVMWCWEVGWEPYD